MARRKMEVVECCVENNSGKNFQMLTKLLGFVEIKVSNCLAATFVIKVSFSAYKCMLSFRCRFSSNRIFLRTKIAKFFKPYRQ